MTETDPKQWFNHNVMASDFYSAVIGDRLGEGAYRAVYRCVFDPKLVFKFETAKGTFSNVSEWDIYSEVRGTPLEKWFAPCVHIADNGNVLIQYYARTIKPKELPKRIPGFFTDLQPTNWGMYRGHPVCRDYGMNHAMRLGLKTKMKPASWFDRVVSKV